MAPNSATAASKIVDITRQGETPKRNDERPVRPENDSPRTQSTSSQSTSSQSTSIGQVLPRSRELNMKSEDDRLKTFDAWPVPYMDKYLMAAAGFFYLNSSDTVMCAFCKTQIGCWEEGDDPFKDHKRWSPSCPYLRRYHVGNIPREGSRAIIPTIRANDTCGPYGMELRPNSFPENTSPQQLLEQLGITQARGPVYAMYVSADARMKSYHTWPRSLKQRPEALCAAGFFYSGRGDQTYCFHCGGGLKDWQDTDDPWLEHAKWFPKCMFIVLNKGREYIEEVLKKRDTVVPVEAVGDLQAPGSEVEVMPTAEPESSHKSEESGKSSCKQMPPEERKSKPVDDSRLCKICFQEELGVLFLPCGHLVACVKCAPALSSCAVCRKPFTATVRAFIP